MCEGVRNEKGSRGYFSITTNAVKRSPHILLYERRTYATHATCWSKVLTPPVVVMIQTERSGTDARGQRGEEERKEQPVKGVKQKEVFGANE